MPIVSGNVSLYNESKATGGGSAILPTPAIGAVGLLEDWEKSATIGFKAEGEAILVIGSARGDSLGQSLWLREVHARADGQPPAVDLYEELEIGGLIRSLIKEGIVTAVHDVSDGGLLVAVAEMALVGNIGADIVPYPFEIGEKAKLARWFSEDQGCYVVTSSDANAVLKAAHWCRVACSLIGYTGGDDLRFHAMKSAPLADLRAAHEGFFPALMGADAALA